MSLKANNVEITKVIFNGNEVNALNFNGASYFGKRFSLTQSSSTGVSFTISRTSSPNQQAATGSISTGNTIYYGDVITISVSAAAGYADPKLFVNVGDGQGIQQRTSPFTLTVGNNVSFYGSATDTVTVNMSDYGNVTSMFYDGNAVEYGYFFHPTSGYASQMTYDSAGNPLQWKGNVLQWNRGRRLTGYGSNGYTYDSGGIRQSKTVNGITHTYCTEGSTIHKEELSDGNKLIYGYDESGIASIEYGNARYYVQKNIQGDVVALVDGNKVVVAKYIYDAWGNHKVYDGDNVENSDRTFIGNINPFRYRGYYYDAESGLCYLQTRYYDPEIGRFINSDSIDYIDTESINGLNLYSYCGNNPVMGVDPEGTLFWFIIIGVAIGAVVGGVSGGIEAHQNGEDVFGGVLSGALVGGALGGVSALGGALGAGAIAANTLTVVGSIGIAAGTSFLAGAGSYAIEQSFNGRDINWGDMAKTGLLIMGEGLMMFGTSAYLGATGLWKSPKSKTFRLRHLIKSEGFIMGSWQYLNYNGLGMLLKYAAKYTFEAIIDKLSSLLE